MVADTGWAAEAPVPNHNRFIETGESEPANTPLDSSELHGNISARIIGNSAPLRRALRLLRVVAPTDSTVLIQGETGTGKELIAEAIHKCSDRSGGPFVKVNCAAIPAELLESELFGHERGAYTGAMTRSIGRFERAHGGTLFLDEISDLPLVLQPKLLRVLQDTQFERLGGSVTIYSNVRVICATNRSLTEMTNERQFRADLFHRLNVFPIEMPPLRERPEDIRLLAHHFAMNYADRLHKPIRAISEDFMTALVRHSWPGNIRELQNVIERSVILSTGAALIGPPPELPCITRDRSQPSQASATLTLKEAQRSHILQALLRTQGVVGGLHGAAARLGLPRTTLIYKMRCLGISPFQSSSAPGRMRNAGGMSSRRSRAQMHNSNRPICEEDREELPSDRATQAVAPLPQPERRRDHQPSVADFIHAASNWQQSSRSVGPQEAISTVGWLSASILHDLRNPVGTIYAGAEMLMTLETMPNQVKRLVANMHRAAGRMRELLTDITSLTDGNRSKPEICDLREVIASASEAAAAATDNQRVQISLDVPSGIEVLLARSRIERVFFNLIINAFEAMPDGGQVRIGARQAGNYVMADIEDTGPGIPNEIRERIFHPFVTAGKANGLGLGLSLSRKAVLDHGGDLWIETAPGARFVMRFPLNRVACSEEVHPLVRSR